MGCGNIDKKDQDAASMSSASQCPKLHSVGRQKYRKKSLLQTDRNSNLVKLCRSKPVECIFSHTF